MKDFRKIKHKDETGRILNKLKSVVQIPKTKTQRTSKNSI